MLELKLHHWCLIEAPRGFTSQAFGSVHVLHFICFPSFEFSLSTLNLHPPDLIASPAKKASEPTERLTSTTHIPPPSIGIYHLIIKPSDRRTIQFKKSGATQSKKEIIEEHEWFEGCDPSSRLANCSIDRKLTRTGNLIHTQACSISATLIHRSNGSIEPIIHRNRPQKRPDLGG